MNTKTNTSRVMRSASLVWGLIVAMLVLFDFTGVSAALAVGTAASTVREQDRDSNLRVPSVSRIITTLDSANYPFTTIMQRTRKGQKPKQVVHRFGQVSTWTRTLTINGATTAGSANANKVVTVDTVELIKPGDVLSAFNNATDATLQYLVVAASGTSLTLKAMPKDTAGTAPYTAVNFGTVPAFADNEVLSWVGNVKGQGADASSPRALMPATDFNYVQTEDIVIKITDHMLRTESFGGPDIRNMERDQLREWRRNWEYSCVFNEAPAVFLDADGNLTWKMGGLKHFAGLSLSLSSSATYANIVEFLYDTFDDNNGGRRRVLAGGAEVMKVFVTVNTGSALNVVRGEKKLGIEITSLIGRKGRLDTVFHPGFDDLGLADEFTVFDPDTMEWNDLQPTEKRKLDLKRSSSGTDAEASQLIQKSTFTVNNPTANGWGALV